MAEFKILSIDGGGIRGIIPCTILKFIESQVGSLSEVFDLISGTSTGGIIAMGLTAPNSIGKNAFTAEDMLNLYVDNGDVIFKRRQKDFLSWLTSFSPLKPMTRMPYDSEGLESLLKEKFRDTRLNQTLTELLITTYEIEHGKPFYFLSRVAQKDAAENFKLIDIARATSAAPTYFEPTVARWKKEEELAFIDGGVFANNPAVLAYCEAKELWKRRHSLVFEPDVKPDDNDLPFFMLSLGTGSSPISLSVKDAKKYKTGNWIRPLTNILMQGVSESTHFTMQHLLPNYTDGTPRYKRHDLTLSEKNSAMDNVSPENIAQLVDLAEEYVQKNKNSLMDICDLLTA